MNLPAFRESNRKVASFVESGDHETAAHMDRMARYSRVIARDTATHFGLSDEQVEHLMLYAPMHDIGKIGIPDSILLKPGKLTAWEYDAIRGHVELGASLLAHGRSTLTRMPTLRELPVIVISGHATVEEAVDYCYYPQVGHRSWGGAARYGTRTGQMDTLPRP